MLGALCVAVLGLSLLPSAAVAEKGRPSSARDSVIDPIVSPDDPADSSQSSGPNSGKNYHRPEVGSCHGLNFKQAYQMSDSRKPVSCETRHTTQTVGIIMIPKRIDVRSESRKFNDYFAPRCISAVDKALGRNDRARAKSAYTSYHFRPTKAEAKRGARWVRCDAALAGDKLLPIPRELRLPRKPGKKLTMCMAGSNLRYTSCLRPHRYRAVGAISLRTKRYPTLEQKRNASRRCQKFIGRKAYAWSYGDYYAWKAGSRALVCYRKTRR